MNEFFEKLRIKLLSVAGCYRQIFRGPVAEEVLVDLALFCRANESTFEADPRVHAAMEGRREVWLHIQERLHLPPEKLWELFVARNSNE